MTGKKSSRTRRGSKRAHPRRRRHRGGAMPLMTPAGVNDKSLMSPSSASLAMGKEYNNIHMGQHGGGFTPMSGAPVGTTGALDSVLRGIARIGPLDHSFNAIHGMKDQAGGRRRSRRSGRSKKRSSRRRMRGGFSNLRPANSSASGSLLPHSMESRAVGGMNPEWKLASNPNAFTPRS